MKSCAEAKEEIIKDTFNKNVDCLECDLASLESIKNFVSSIEKSRYFNKRQIKNILYNIFETILLRRKTLGCVGKQRRSHVVSQKVHQRRLRVSFRSEPFRPLLPH